MFRTAASVLCLATALAGCGDDESTPAGKAAEEAALGNYESDSKADSWREPTDHGRLLPGRSGAGEFTRETLFHAWTFQLASESAVELTTSAADQNLDTVMYLYRQDPETGYWGRYIKKNDDTQGTVFSRIKKTLDAGTYRIIVKGHKTALRGAFSVDLACEGEGCQVGEVVEPSVGDYGYTAGCAAKLHTVLNSAPVGEGYDYVSLADLDGLSPIHRAAAIHFRDAALDWADEEELAESELEIGSVDLEHGHIVDVTTGADWSYSYVFDARGQLLVEYFNDQSPWAEFFCKVEGEAQAEAPDEWCVSGMMNNLPREADAATLSLPGEVGEAQQHWIALAEGAYRLDTGVGADANLNWVLTHWTSDRLGLGGEFAVSAEGQPEIVYTVGGDAWDGYLYFSRKGDEVEARCLTKDDLADR